MTERQKIRRSRRGAPWLARAGLLVLGILLPEAIARVAFPQHGLTFAATIARDSGLHRPKTTTEKRIFVFGASSVVGYHHLGRSSLSQAIEFLLKEAEPGRDWTVVNFGKPGEGSQFVFDAATESLRYDPDLLVIYAGESEFAPIPILRRRARYQLERLLLKSKAFRVARDLSGGSAWLSVPDFRKYQWVDVTTRADRDRERIVTDFQKRGIALCARKSPQVGMAILEPVLGLQTGPSFYDEIDKWDLNLSLPGTRAYVRGILDQEAGNYRQAVEHFREALTYERNFASLHHRLGICLLALGDVAGAEKAMRLASQLDPMPRCVSKESFAAITNRCADGLWLPLPDRVAQRRKRSRVPEELIEDGCHATVPLEFEEAQIILDEPYVQKRLGLTRRLSAIPYARYQMKKQLDDTYFATVYLRLVHYFQGSPDAQRYLRQAIRADPKHPGLPRAREALQRDQTGWQKRRQRVLNAWRVQLRQHPSS